MCFMRGPSHTTVGGEPADEAEKAGIQGFCPKSEAECIIEAVEMLLRGKKYFPPAVH